MIELWHVLLAFAVALWIGGTVGFLVHGWMQNSKVRDVLALLPPPELMRWIAMDAQVYAENYKVKQRAQRLVAHADAIERAGY